MVSEDDVSRERARGEIFRLLSACLCEPDKNAFAEEGVFEQLDRAVERLCPEALPTAREMKAAFSTQTEEELAVEHARLFVGPHRLPAPPYGSVYLERGRTVMGRSTVDVTAFYRSEGVHVDGEAAEPPDHIAIELEFAHYLISRELAEAEAGNADAAENLRRKREEFLRDLVFSWAPRWCDDIVTSTDNAYYTPLARLLLALVKQPGCLLPTAARAVEVEAG